MKEKQAFEIVNKIESIKRYSFTQKEKCEDDSSKSF